MLSKSVMRQRLLPLLEQSGFAAEVFGTEKLQEHRNSFELFIEMRSI